MATMSNEHTPEVTRLERLWSGEFGDAYTERNREAGKWREPFWRATLSKYPVKRVLEIGCNLGGNLEWISKIIPAHEVYGVDINESALQRLRGRVPNVNALWSPARQLPFRDGFFDLVFTAGVLIHQPDETLPLVMSEIVRCSRKYVLASEYFAETKTEVPYRGHSGALFKRDYGGLYQTLFPELKLLNKGFLPKSEGWDDATWWMFEKTNEH
jgi:pseudaminic acid biosynthesis-associated methylase